VAVNCSLVPLAIELFGALMAMDCSTAGVTVSVKVLEVTPLKVAVMFEVPVPAPVAKPVVLMVATAGVAEFQLTWLVMLAVEVSL
jgi:hypothetical protein